MVTQLLIVHNSGVCYGWSAGRAGEDGAGAQLPAGVVELWRDGSRADGGVCDGLERAESRSEERTVLAARLGFCLDGLGLKVMSGLEQAILK
jgi:hypothetical protein